MGRIITEMDSVDSQFHDVIIHYKAFTDIFFDLINYLKALALVPLDSVIIKAINCKPDRIEISFSTKLRTWSGIVELD